MYDGEIPFASIQVLVRGMMLQIGIIVLPVFAAGVFIVFVCDVVQVKWKPTTKPLKPKFSKLNPVSGFKKVFISELAGGTGEICSEAGGSGICGL